MEAVFDIDITLVYFGSLCYVRVSIALNWLHFCSQCKHSYLNKIFCLQKEKLCVWF